MEIGGYDLKIIVVEPLTNKDLANQIMEFVNWPNSIKEDASLDGSDEFFWYRDAKALKAWDDDVEENTMIHFIFENKDRLTVVSDKKHHEEICSFLKSKKEAIIEE